MSELAAGTRTVAVFAAVQNDSPTLTSPSIPRAEPTRPVFLSFQRTLLPLKRFLGYVQLFRSKKEVVDPLYWAFSGSDDLKHPGNRAYLFVSRDPNIDPGLIAEWLAAPSAATPRPEWSGPPFWSWENLQSGRLGSGRSGFRIRRP